MGTVAALPGRLLRGLRSAVARSSFVDAPATAEERRRDYERDGFVAGGPLLDRRELARLRAAFDEVFERGGDPGSGVSRQRVEVGTREFYRVVDLHRVHPAFAALVRHPRLAEVASDLVGLDALRVLMDQVQYKPPRTGGRNAWHRDKPSFPLRPPYTGFTAWIALDDATERTGCMSMVPGSHLWGDASDLAVEGDGWGLPSVSEMREYRGHPVVVVPRPVPAGHVHFHHDLTWHCSGRNGTRHKRRALAIHFVGADDRYRAGGRTVLPGLSDGDRLDAAAPIVVGRRATALAEAM
jgi:ectoine hydroxylase-related dioxygenase (phytanoyl-CoA dioxygenase family)